jgi:CRP/FNR family transcriptional regulator, cyclic AMP receptor protein
MATTNSGPVAPLDFFKRIDVHATSRDYIDRQEIYTQSDHADALFYIRSGYVKLTVKAKDGKKAVIGILHHGDFFGEGCLVNRSLRRSTATAVHPCTIARVPRTSLARVIHQEPAFAKLFISHLLLRIGRIEEEFVDQIFSSSEKRLARILLAMAGFGNQTDRGPVELKVSQETLAEMVGTTRSRVSYFMNRFRKLGFINYNGTLEVYPALQTFLTLDQPANSK